MRIKFSCFTTDIANVNSPCEKQESFESFCDEPANILSYNAWYSVVFSLVSLILFFILSHKYGQIIAAMWAWAQECPAKHPFQSWWSWDWRDRRNHSFGTVLMSRCSLICVILFLNHFQTCDHWPTKPSTMRFSSCSKTSTSNYIFPIASNWVHLSNSTMNNF